MPEAPRGTEVRNAKKETEKAFAERNAEAQWAAAHDIDNHDSGQFTDPAARCGATTVNGQRERGETPRSRTWLQTSERRVRSRAFNPIHLDNLPSREGHLFVVRLSK